jgi:predicted DNA-binding transcriptional regulator AlpA
MSEELLTIGEVAKLIDIPKSQVLKHRTKLNLPKPAIILNAHYYKKCDVEAWMERTDLKSLMRTIIKSEYEERVKREKASGTYKPNNTLHWQGLCERFDVPLELYVKFCTGRLYYDETS